jgi:hypothetical protein
VTAPWWCVVAGSQPEKPPLEAQAPRALSREQGATAVSLGVVAEKRRCGLLSCNRTFTARQRQQRFCGRRCRDLARTWPVRKVA